MKIVFGLGNPGRLYQKTRHNVGFMVVSRLARKMGLKFEKKYCSSRVAEGEAIVLAKPYTYVNLSGKAAKALLQRFSLSPQDMLVICDDVALPLGRIRIRRKGSDGGHNGLRSIIKELGTEDFPRLRVGIGREGIKDLVEYVLGEFEKEEMKILEKVLDVAVDAVECILKEGIEEAMNKYNSFNLLAETS
ncbi:aminoacyl-tRNA hydrolase [bacterium]|nr:aminoacyl-tRNA hydrolase [bacterium]